jgi:hypothetical protein
LALGLVDLFMTESDLILGIWAAFGFGIVFFARMVLTLSIAGGIIFLFCLVAYSHRLLTPTAGTIMIGGTGQATLTWCSSFSTQCELLGG